MLGYLRELGATVVSADDIAKEALEDAEVVAQIGAEFGFEPPLERAKLRELVQSARSRRSLNRIMHGIVRERLQAIRANFVEIPLLVEAALLSDYDGVWVVTCGIETQVARLMERYGDDANIAQLLNSQLPTRAKLPFADVIVRTNLPPARVMAFVSEALAWERSRGLTIS